MATIVLRSIKGSPLSIAEADANFSNLNADIGQKLDSSAYTADDVFTKVLSKDGSGSGLDADLLDGLNASSTDTEGNSVVSRNNGSFSAKNITAATFTGNLTGNVIGNVTGNVSGSATSINGVVPVSNGGTGATTAGLARTALGLGSIATQGSDNVTITGGSISGISDLAIADGGTGASTVTQARINLGLVIGTDVQPFSNELTGIAGALSTGLYTRTGTGTVTQRSITVAGNGLTITNGDGVAGNPSISIPTNATMTLSSLSLTAANTATLAATTSVTTPTLIKSGTTDSGDIGQANNRYNNIYAKTHAGDTANITTVNSTTVNCQTLNTAYFAIDSVSVSNIVKTGANGYGDIGQTSNRFYRVNAWYSTATYGDLAERYTTDKEYEPGTVIAVSQDDSGAEGTCSWMIAQRVLGVVSTNPAFLMNDELDGQAIALRGRVPVKIAGPIRKGQPVIAAPDGVGVYGDQPNSFAIALESNSDAGVKLVECVIL